MFDKQKAAQWLVVAWCKEWSLGTYLDAVVEGEWRHDLSAERVAAIQQAFPWMPVAYKMYHRGVRDFIGATYPKLSQWLWSRADDASRLRCAPQIEKLRNPGKHAGFVKPEDRKEMRSSEKAMRRNTASYRLSRESFKTHQRSAWNVCKG